MPLKQKNPSRKCWVSNLLSNLIFPICVFSYMLIWFFVSIKKHNTNNVRFSPLGFFCVLTVLGFFLRQGYIPWKPDFAARMPPVHVFTSPPRNSRPYLLRAYENHWFPLTLSNPYESEGAYENHCFWSNEIATSHDRFASKK